MLSISKIRELKRRGNLLNTYFKDPRANKESELAEHFKDPSAKKERELTEHFKDPRAKEGEGTY